MTEWAVHRITPRITRPNFIAVLSNRLSKVHINSLLCCFCHEVLSRRKAKCYIAKHVLQTTDVQGWYLYQTCSYPMLFSRPSHLEVEEVVPRLPNNFGLRSLISSSALFLSVLLGVNIFTMQRRHVFNCVCLYLWIGLLVCESVCLYSKPV